MKKFLAVLNARNNEFIRDRSALGWNILFPVLVVFGFGFAFSGNNQGLFKVAYQTGAGTAPAALTEFLKTRHIEFVPVTDLDFSIQKLKQHRFDMVVSSEAQPRYWINSTSPKGYLVERLLGGVSGTSFARGTVEGRESRYVDWLISGLLAMNMMFSALFGVGYNIVRYRKTGVLKRLKATPLTAFEFLLVQVVSRLLLIVAGTTVVFIGTHAILHFQMLGSYFDLALVMILGAICLISLGVLLAARVKSEEFAGGMLNLISWPMMFLSGVWFSLEGAHPWVQKAAQVFPLTHMIDASRAIMTEGATLAAVSGNLITLVVMSAIFLGVGAATFKWQ